MTLRRGVALLTLLSLVGLLVAPLPAQERRAPETSREAELVALRAEIARLSARLDETRQRQSGLEGELAAADLSLDLQQKRLAEAQTAHAEAVRKAQASEEQVRGLEAALYTSRADFQRRLTGLYRLGRQGYLRLFFLLKPDRRLLPSIRWMRYLVRRDRDTVARYQDSRRRLAIERDHLLAERREVESWMASEEARRRELFAVRGRKAELLARAEREGQALAGRTTELAERERKLASFLDLLFNKNTDPMTGAAMQGFRGVLDWPIKGKITEGFGPRLDPRYRTQVPHNGVDLATAAGSEVHAVFPGKVLFAAPFEGYGPTVVVHHPGRVLTLYAGLQELKVSREGMVSLGDAVGLASDKLYFEIRVENRPDDPLSWLR